MNRVLSGIVRPLSKRSASAGRVVASSAAAALALLTACLEPFDVLQIPSDPLQGSFAVALAGPDLAVVEGARVVLGGGASRGNAGEARLVWTQREGPPVALTNPSSATPSFVAPLAPATLVFSLRAESDGVADEDTVSVVVAGTSGAPGGYLTVPADVVAAPGERVSFDVTALEVDDPSLTVRSPCIAPDDIVIDGARVTVVVPAALPCAVVIDATGPGGRGAAPTARVLWPAGSDLPGTTRVTAPLSVRPSGTLAVSFSDGSELSVPSAFGASGDPALPDLVVGAVLAFTAPRQRERLVVGGEVRRGGASGGVRYAIIDVTSGPASNTAPVARGGPDRIVTPGARFRFDTTASFDADGDALVVSARQVQGAQALPDDETSAIFVAPNEEGTLLFHVVADDGAVESAPDPVRVVVSSAAENLRPIIPLASERYVTPGQTFMIDASVAEDPDSGFIAGFLIAQDTDDPIVLLPEPLAQPSASFVAQAAGDTYHFLVSAFDEEGLGTTIDVTIFVEDAGPWIDPARGDDALGNGTEAAPFATIAAALDTALRHELDALLLAEGEHAAPPPDMPPGLDVRGGHGFTDGAYVETEEAETVIDVIGTSTWTSSRIERVTLVVPGSGAVRLRGGATIADTTVRSSEGARTTPLVDVPAGAQARIERSTVDAGAASGAVAIHVSADAVGVLVDSVVVGGSGVDAAGVTCVGGTIVVEGGSITGSTGTSPRSTGIDATSCAVALSEARVAGGSGDVAVGLAATNALVGTDSLSRIVGRTVSGGEGIGAQLAGSVAPMTLEGTVATASIEETVPLQTSSGTALALFGARVVLNGTRLLAHAPGARAIAVVGGAISGTGVEVAAGGAAAVAVRAEGAVALSFTDGSVAAPDDDGVALELVGTGVVVELDGTTVVAGAQGIDAPGAHVTLTLAHVAVSGNASARAPVGVAAAGVDIARSRLEVSGADAVALATSAPSLVESTSIALTSSGIACAGIRSSDALELVSSFVDASSAGCVGIDSSTGSALLLHVTVRAGTAVVTGTGNLVVHNSALEGAPAIASAAQAAFTEAIGVAFDDTSPLVTLDDDVLADLPALQSAGCDLCQVAVLADLIDANGRLVDGLNPLVDAADPVVSTAFDLDGEARPRGPAPDIGCDER